MTSSLTSMSSSTTAAIDRPPSSLSSLTSTTASKPTTPTSPRAGQAEARAAVLASLTSAGSTHDSKLQLRASDLHANAAALTAQETQLAAHTKALAADTKQWQREAERAAKAIKNVGDVQNWAEMLERDLCILEETVRLVESDGAERPEQSASGGSWWRA